MKAIAALAALILAAPIAWNAAAAVSPSSGGSTIAPVGWSGFSTGSATDRDAFHDSLVAPLKRNPVAPPISDAPTAVSTVVLIKVGRVALPASLPGICRVQGVIQEVKEGVAFAEGAPVSISVPCGHQAKVSPIRSEIAAPLDVEVLSKAKLGLARIDSGGRLVWQDDDVQLPDHRPGSGPQLTVWGYRVLDGALLPAGVSAHRS